MKRTILALALLAATQASATAVFVNLTATPADGQATLTAAISMIDDNFCGRIPGWSCGPPVITDMSLTMQSGDGQTFAITSASPNCPPPSGGGPTFPCLSSTAAHTFTYAQAGSFIASIGGTITTRVDATFTPPPDGMTRIEPPTFQDWTFNPTTHSVALTITSHAPEPETYALMIAGLALLRLRFNSRPESA